LAREKQDLGGGFILRRGKIKNNVSFEVLLTQARKELEIDLAKMTALAEQPTVDFYTFPPIGGDDWRYTFATARVRVLESLMLTKAAFSDMANAESFDQAVDLLGAGEYALPKGERGFTQVENILLQRRSDARILFADLMIDQPLVDLIRTRDDFANMRLAIRRKLTERPLGTDYSNDGNVPAELFEEIFEEENHSPLPDYMQEAIERAVLAYYQNKDIRQIDFALDHSQAQYTLQESLRLNSIFG
jgi:hypothetical protein